jgi:hypothetical protein
MKCGKEKEKERLGDEVAKSKGKEDWVMKCGFPFSLPKFITQSFLSFLFVTLHHPIFFFLSLCHTSSPSLLFPFSLPHFITQSSLDWVINYGKEKGKGRLGDDVWQRERKRKIG